MIDNRCNDNQSCVKIETRKDNRNSVKIYYSTILNNNCNYYILYGRMFTVKNSQSNEFITVVNVKSKVK